MDRLAGGVQCRQCRYQGSVTAGTIFHHTRLPLRTWFLAIFLLAHNKQGISAVAFQRIAGIGSYQSAWHLLHRIRSTLHHREGFLLSGLVEVDETYLGARASGKRGRGANHKHLVVCAVEHHDDHAGSVRLQVVEDASQEELEPFVCRVVNADQALVLTDGWKGYAGLGKANLSHHATVQGSAKNAHKVLPWVHTVFANLKSWLRGTFHGVSRRHLGRYLHEFVYRFDRRQTGADLFHFILRRAVKGQPLTYEWMTAAIAG